jgi:hybrid cluster-associated redox disulfide protein
MTGRRLQTAHASALRQVKAVRVCAPATTGRSFRPILAPAFEEDRMNSTEITEDTVVEELMAAHPGTISVFLRRRMSCVGCVMAPFHTVADAGAEHYVPLDMLLAELRDAAAAATTAPP